MSDEVREIITSDAPAPVAEPESPSVLESKTLAVTLDKPVDFLGVQFSVVSVSHDHITLRIADGFNLVAS